MNCTMRDNFWNQIYELAQMDSSIVIVSADFGAPSLDKFRRDYPKQYINVGISEQNAILVATGLALVGKKPIVYAISQFITLRCFEQIRIYPCGMNLPITIVGVGAGVSYWESGPTHHCMEQISVMRTLPHLKMINCSDLVMAKYVAEYVVKSQRPIYIQLDRECVDEIDENVIDFNKGYRWIGRYNKNLVIATGIMVKEIIEIKKEYNFNFSVIDIFSLPVEKELFVNEIKGVDSIITVEENVKEGGIGSYILELLSDFGILVSLSRVALKIDKGYAPSYTYGSRENIREAYGIGKKEIINTIKNKFYKTKGGQENDKYTINE